MQLGENQVKVRGNVWLAVGAARGFLPAGAGNAARADEIDIPEPGVSCQVYFYEKRRLHI